MTQTMFLDSFPKLLQEQIPKLGAFKNYSRLSGGDINQAVQLKFENRNVFVKYNDAERYPQMFEKEAQALAHLNAKTHFFIPEVLATGEWEGQGFLVLEFMEASEKAPSFWEDFGLHLAAMHQQSREAFGWDGWNYMGSLRQDNTAHAHWVDFFVECRLEPQFKMAREQGYFNSQLTVQAQRLYHRLESLVPQDPPALLHGDLWSGNYAVAPKGEPALIDPAIHYGHREADLAMMHLFGGFPTELFTQYHAQFPLETNWQERLNLHNLYPVLVHVNLFGGAYETQAQSMLKQYL